MMLVGPMKKKLVTTVIVVVVVLTAFFCALGYFLLSAKQSEINNLVTKAEVVERYVFTKNFSAGHVIDSEDLVLAAVKAESTPDNSYEEKIKVTAQNREKFYNITGTNYKPGESINALELLAGRRLKIDVSKNTTLTEDMLVDIDGMPTDDLRLEEFAMITLPSDTVKGEYVDVRIAFPTGEDFSVLIGKKVEKYTDNTVFFKLTEDDILSMSSAIVEAYLYEGTEIYATKYVDPFNQLYNHTKVDYVEKYQAAISALIELKQEEKLKELIAKFEKEQSEEYLAMVMEYPETYEEELAKIYEKDIKVEKEDITVEEIAKYIGLTVYETEQIEVALNSEDEVVLERYRNKIETSRKQLARTYPVNEAVLNVIKNNPNILQEVRDNFDKNALIAAQVKKFEYTLYDEEDEIEEAYEKLVEKVTNEIQLQKDERVKYLTSLISE